MSKFNKASTQPKVYSANGNLQFAKDEKQQAYELVINSLYGRDTAYESTDEKTVRLNNIVKSLVAKGELDFLANLMVFARTEMHIRNMPIVGTIALINSLYTSGVNWVGTRKLVSEVVQRADQITDMLALMNSKAKMPMALKRGLSDAFNKFSEYQFAKYNRTGKVTLKDAMRIVHPVPKDQDNSDLFAKIMAGTLKTPDTWEVELSSKGNTKEVWEGLIDRKVLGFEATLKNLRNMLKVEISQEHKKKVGEFIVSQGLKARALPFQFLAAMESIEGYNCQTLNAALMAAMDVTAENVPKLGNRALVMLDVSGSMQFDSSRAAKNACFLTAVLVKSFKGECIDVVAFGSNAQWVKNLNPYMPLYQTYLELRKMNGGSTNFGAALDLAGSSKPYDVVFCLTDGEIDTLNNNQKPSNFHKQAERYVINCAAAKSTPLPSIQGWNALAGWSPNLFKYIDAIRNGDSMIEQLSKPFV